MSYRRDTIVYDPEDDYWVPTAYPGYYASEQGYIWGPGRYGNGKILKPTPDRTGHLYVTICVGGEQIRKYVHRLIAEAFISNPMNYPIVRHLDDDPSNNHVDNLAWGTSADNVRDSIRNGTAYVLRQRTPLKAMDLTNGDEFYFESQKEAARVLGVCEAAINRSLRFKQEQVNGYIFCYPNEDFQEYYNSNHRITYAKILATNLNTGEQYIFNSQKEAEEILGINNRMINRVLKNTRAKTHGYSFEYIFERSV